jgi:hypothetical protein
MTLNVQISKNVCKELFKPMFIEVKLVCVTCKDKFRYIYVQNWKNHECKWMWSFYNFLNDRCHVPFPCNYKCQKTSMVNVTTMNLKITLIMHLEMVEVKQHGNSKANRNVMTILCEARWSLWSSWMWELMKVIDQLENIKIVWINC